MSPAPAIEGESRGVRWAWSAALGLLAAAFAASGLAKLVGAGAMVEAFQAWGYPSWALYAVGGTELLAAGALLVPRVHVLGRPVRFWGAAVLATVMVGAVGTHLVHGEYASLLPPAILLALAGWVAIRAQAGGHAGAGPS